MTKIQKKHLLLLGLIVISSIFIGFNFNESKNTCDKNLEINNEKIEKEPEKILKNSGFWDDDTPKEEWTEIWDGGDTDKGFGITVDSNDDIISVGTTYAEPFNYDILIVKYNSSGTEVWNRTWDGGQSERAYSVVIDKDDNIYLTGKSYLTTGDEYNIFLLKYNSTGNLEWSSIHGGDDGNDYGYGIDIDSDGNIFIVGITYSQGNPQGDDQGDVILLKYNNLGEYQWNKTWGTYGIVDEGIGISIDQSTNDIYITGNTDLYSSEPGHTDILILKYNKTGDYQWHKTCGDEDTEERGYDIQFYSNESIYITGRARTPLNFDEVIILKYNSSGDLIWDIRRADPHHPESNNMHCSGFSLFVDSQEYIYVAGYWEYFFGPGYYNYLLLLKYNSSGTKIWELETNERVAVSEIDRGGLDMAMDSCLNLYVVTSTPYMDSKDLLVLKYNLYPPGPFILNSTAPDINGNFKLNWSNSVGADDYSIYWYNTLITEGNMLSATLVESGLTNNSYFIFNFPEGTFFL